MELKRGDLEPMMSTKALYLKSNVTPREVTQKGEVSIGIGISLSETKDSSLETGAISSMSEEDIRTETLGGVAGNPFSEGSQTGFQLIS